MSLIVDDFSFDHPDNKANKRWKRLVSLPKNDLNYILVEKQFQMGWKHPKKSKPEVRAIFKILHPETILKSYNEYRSRTAASPSLKGSRFKSSRNPANEQLLFHGTNRCCLLGEDSNRVRLCSLAECHLCSVVRNSFDIHKCGTKHKFRRFGTGIYTTACSSKADDYSFNADPNSTLRVLLVNRVIVGKPHKRRENATNLTEPPCGHHSVIGEPGVDLNYEETVVYNNDAIRPAYLIVYGDAPEVVSKIRILVSTLFKTPLAS